MALFACKVGGAEGVGDPTVYTLSVKTFGTTTCVFNGSTIPHYDELVLNENLFLKKLPNFYTVTALDAPIGVNWSYNASNGNFTVTINNAKFLQPYVGTLEVVAVR